MIEDSTYELIQSGKSGVETFNYYYNEILEQIDDKDERNSVRKKLLQLTTDVLRGKERSEKINAELPTKEKRNIKLKNLSKSIVKIIKSMEIITGDVERERRQKEYIENLKSHRAEIQKLIKGASLIDIEFGTIDCKKRPQITKKKIRDYLEEIIKKYNIKVTNNTIKDAINGTTCSKF